MFVCAVAAEWFFPPVETTNKFSAAQMPYKVEHSRPFVTETSLGESWSIEQIGVPRRVIKMRTINRESQLLQSLLIVAFFLGLRWVINPTVFRRWLRRPTARAA